MRRLTILLLLLSLKVLLSSAGCSNREEEERKKWEVTLEHDDRKPYGTYLAYQSLQYFFRGATIQALQPGMRLNNLNELYTDSAGHSLLVLQGLSFNLSDKEWVELKRFIANGNYVLIFASSLDDKMRRELRCEIENSGMEEISIAGTPKPFTDTQALSLSGATETKYGYKGRGVGGYFTNKNGDTSMQAPVFATETDDNEAGTPTMRVLGYTHDKPDFIRYHRGDGHLTLHCAPLVLSNYFLLQPRNVQYLEGIWNTLPAGITHVYWNDYLHRSGSASGLDVLMRYPATRMGIYLALLVLAVYVVFEGKRRQRIVPIIPPVRNDSVSFVETVGRLYYNKRNHANLAAKMCQQFLEWVRNKYQLNTNSLNPDFVKALASKTGRDEATVHNLVEMIHEVKLGTTVIDEPYLYQLYTTIRSFTKA